MDISNLPKHRATLSNSTTNLHSKGTLLRVTLSNLPRATPSSSLLKVTLAKVRLIRLSNNLLQATQAILHSQAPLASPSGGRFGEKWHLMLTFNLIRTPDLYIR